MECYNAEIIVGQKIRTFSLKILPLPLNTDQIAFIQLYQVKGEKTEEVNFEEFGKVLAQTSLSKLPATEESSPEKIEQYKRSGEDDETGKTLPINTKVVYQEVSDYVRPERRR